MQNSERESPVEMRWKQKTVWMESDTMEKMNDDVVGKDETVKRFLVCEN